MPKKTPPTPAAPLVKIYVEYMPLTDLISRRHPENPKDHDLGSLDGSMQQFGYTDPLLLDERTGKLAAGHGRLENLQARLSAGQPPPEGIDVREGEWYVPVNRGVSFKSDRELKAYLIAANRMTILGGWNEQALAKLLQDIQLGGDALLRSTGYDDQDLQFLLADLNPLTGAGMTNGFTPSQKADTFLNATIKQIIIYFEEKDYNDVVLRLARVRRLEGVDSNTEAILKLLEHYDRDIPNDTGSEAPAEPA